ncbi:hypothetical protein KAR91_76835 [Candidatus Pacearchaeota archaeon]|nr:hypothetical protein [Candidatus Pacearchaeota archaeon]
MSLFKRWIKDEPAPTAAEKAGAESFKQILKYGEDIGGMFKDVTARLDALFKEKREIREICEKAIIKQQKLKFKTNLRSYNWNGIYIREYRDCKKSPIGCCVTMIEYGSNNPEKDKPQPCFYCKKEY